MKRIKGLDGLRGFAALCIMIFHVNILGGYVGNNLLIDKVFGRSDCFVRLFFMLSSFSLMCAHFENYCKGKFDTAEFLRKRVTKIFPLFLLIEAGHIVINYIGGTPNNIHEIIGSASMLFALFPTQQDSVVWAGWSMGIQMVFYLIFPTFLALCKTKRSTWVMCLTCAVLLNSYLNLYGVGAEAPHINIVRQMIYFSVGALIFHYKDQLIKLDKPKKIFVCLVCVIVEVIAVKMWSLTRWKEDTIMLIAFSALIILQITGVDWLMNNPVFCWLGKISYEVYLIHPLVYRTEYLLGIPERRSFFVHCCFVIVPTILLACLWQYLIKKLKCRKHGTSVTIAR